ncbi:MAG TPA: GNAT family N-acetyltransferase [Rectinemataceae bacterium]
MNSLDLQEFERVASRTGAFKGVEIDLLHETLLSWKSSPGDPYTVLELRDGKTLAAFAIIARVAGREATYDIRYLVVDRDYRSSGGGARLLQMLDEDLLKRNSFAVIRYETSTIKVGNMGPNRFEEAGYKVVGHIPGYYGETDDYFYLMKTIYRNPPKFETLGADPPSAQGDTSSPQDSPTA